MTLIYQSERYSTGLNPKSFIINDFNRDYIPDLAVTNFGDDTLGLMFGNGDGTFQSQQTYSTGNGSKPWGITAHDFNNDTFLDLGKTLYLDLNYFNTPQREKQRTDTYKLLSFSDFLS
jgi:hypothetical protein